MISEIQSEIWAAIIATLSTLAGVLISNRHSTNSLKIQLAHDERVRASEQLTKSRTEVYLAAAEGLQKLSTGLATLPSLDPRKESQSLIFKEFQAASAKLQLIANPETALLCARVSDAYAGIYVDLAPLLIKISDEQINIEILQNQYDLSSKEVDRILSAMKNMSEQADINQQVFASLSSSFEFHRKQAEEFDREKTDCLHERQKIQKNYSEQLLIKLKEIMPLQFALMSSIRQELGVKGGVSEIEALANENFRKLSLKLDGFYSSLETEAPN